jgi:hypothetical protein
MKRIGWSVLIGILLLTACGQATAVPVIPSVTLTPSIPPTSTQTSLPSDTPTASITPLPTLPTFTPTFDVSTILTVTPAPQAGCPKEDPSSSLSVKPNRDYPLFDPQEILDLLNEGISINTLSSTINNPGFEPLIISRDATGDQTPEILFVNLEPIGHVYIYTCSKGKYILTSPRITYYGFDTKIIDVKDLNSNGIPEVILEHSGCSGNGCYSIYVLQWTGSYFQVINSDPEYGEQMTGMKSIEINDLNRDNLFEVVMTGGVPALGAYILNPPWRLETKILAWNGEVFALRSNIFDDPQFRFQAIHDADLASINGNYEEALNFYQLVISSDDLDWWSEQRRDETIVMLSNEGDRVMGTPAPGILDPSEYPSLAAYAYYRIMLLHLVQNHESDAMTVYNTLQQKFGSDPYGHAYAEMATAFWEAYQSTHKMYDGCAAAIQYAVEHPEILTPLGSDYHGPQAKIYKPEDVCPFR